MRETFNGASVALDTGGSLPIGTTHLDGGAPRDGGDGGGADDGGDSAAVADSGDGAKVEDSGDSGTIADSGDLAERQGVADSGDAGTTTCALSMPVEGSLVETFTATTCSNPDVHSLSVLGNRLALVTMTFAAPIATATDAGEAATITVEAADDAHSLINATMADCTVTHHDEARSPRPRRPSLAIYDQRFGHVRQRRDT